MLQIKNLTITHRKDLRVILEDFNMTLNDGDKAVIIGEEGNGKSTLMKWLYQPGMVEDYTECEGIRILGQERLGYLPQELPAKERERSIYEYFSEANLFFEQTPKELAALARKFSLPTDIYYSDQQMETLSGGEKVKLQLMRLLLDEPTVLLLDEPSNDIDIETLELLEQLINEWRGIVLYISHDETLIERTANVIIHLEQIQRKTKSRYTVMKTNYTEYIKRRADAFAHQAQMAESDRRAKKQRDEKYRRILQSVNHAQVTINGAGKDLADKMQAAHNLKDKMHTVKSIGRRFEKQDEQMTEMPEQEEAIFFKLGKEESKMPAGKTVVEYALDELLSPDQSKILAKDISLCVRGPERICIIGKNGVGKTTLLKQMAEELLQRRDIRVQYMPQNYEDLLDFNQTPVEFLDNTGDKEVRTRIRTYLGSLKYTADEMDHPIGELSGGQKAKVLLLKMSLSDANVLILDEPTRNFSPLSGPVIRQMICQFPGAVISISHDRKYIKECCTKVYELTANGLHSTAGSMD